MRPWLAIIATLLTLGLIGCQPDSSILPTATPPPSETARPTGTPPPTQTPTPVPTASFGRSVTTSVEAATLTFIHADPSLDAVDVYINGQLAVPNLPYGQLARELAVLPGEITVGYAPSGDAGLDSERASTFDVQPNSAMTVILGSGDGSDAWIVVNRPLAPLSGGTTRATLVNATDSPTSPVLVDLEQAFPTVAAHSQSEPVVLQSGGLDLTVATDQLSLTEQQILRERFESVLILTGTTDSPRLIRQDTPVSGLFSLRIINLAQAAPEFDVYLDDVLVASNLQSMIATEFDRRVAGAFSLSIAVTGTDMSVSPPLIDSFRAAANPDTQVSVLIVGDETNLQITVVQEDVTPVAPGQTRVIFVNALPSASIAQVRTVESEIGIPPIGFGRASLPQTLPAGEHSLIWADASGGGSDVLENFSPLQFPEGQTLIYALTGNQDSPPAIFGTDIGVDTSLVSGFEANPTRSPRVRPINAIKVPQNIDILLDDVLAFSSLGYGEGGSLFEVAGSSVHLVVRIPDGPVLIDQRIALDAHDYSLIIYGEPTSSGVPLLLIDDSQLEFRPDSARVRLINLSLPPAEYGVGLGIANNASATAIATTPTTPLDRPLAPSNVFLVTSEVISLSGSRPTQAFIGFRDVYVLDSERRIVAVLPSTEFVAGTHTDFLAYEFRTETGVETRVWKVSYPPR